MDLLEAIAAMCIVLGIYLYGFKSPLGPLVSGLGCLLCTIIMYFSGLPWMVLLNLTLAAMHFINLVKWSDTNAVI